MRFSRKKKIDWESHEYKRARYHYLLLCLQDLKEDSLWQNKKMEHLL